MGQAFHKPDIMEGSEYRDQRRALQLFLPDDEELSKNEMLSNSDGFIFRKKAISAAIRLELIAFRFGASDETSPQLKLKRLVRASEWARWLAIVDRKPASRRLYLTAQQTLGQHAQQHGFTETATKAWKQLVDDWSQWIDQGNARPDQLQALAHARLKRLELESDLKAAESEYRKAIDELNLAWSLTDSDSFYRTNLASAEFSLAQTIVHKQQSDGAENFGEAVILLGRALATYQELLREDVTIDRLRRLAETHFTLATLHQDGGIPILNRMKVVSKRTSKPPESRIR